MKAVRYTGTRYQYNGERDRIEPAPRGEPSERAGVWSERESGCAMTPARPAGLNAVFSIR